MFNTPRNGKLGHFGDGLSVRLAIGILHKEFFRPVSSYFSAVERGLPRNAVYPEIEDSWRNS